MNEDNLGFDFKIVSKQFLRISTFCRFRQNLYKDIMHVRLNFLFIIVFFTNLLLVVLSLFFTLYDFKIPRQVIRLLF